MNRKTGNWYLIVSWLVGIFGWSIISELFDGDLAGFTWTFLIVLAISTPMFGLVLIVYNIFNANIHRNLILWLPHTPFLIVLLFNIGLVFWFEISDVGYELNMKFVSEMLDIAILPAIPTIISASLFYFLCKRTEN